MQVQKHPAARGLFWLSEGLRILGRQPFALMLLTMLVVIMMLLTIGIQVIGPLISLTFMPAIYVGWMKAIRTCDEGGTPNPVMLFEVFKRENSAIWQPLIILGLINAALTIGAKMLAMALAPGETTVLDNVDDGTGVKEVPVNLWWPLLLLLLYAPIQMALWYAPLIIAWHQQPVTKSIFFSLVAFWRNKWAFAALFVSWFWLAVIAIVVVQLVGVALNLSRPAMQFLTAPALLFILTALQCSFWVTYRDVFEPGEPGEPPPPSAITNT